MKLRPFLTGGTLTMLFWLVIFSSSVHEHPPKHDDPNETYGWEVPLKGMTVFLTVAGIFFLAGREHEQRKEAK